MDGILRQIELSMGFIIRKLGRGRWMTVHIRAAVKLVVGVGDGIRICVAQHLVNGFTRLDVAVKAIGNSFIQKVGRLAVKGFTVRKRGSGGQIMPGDDFRIIMTLGTYLGNVSRISDLMQSGRHVIIKPVNKLI